MQRYVAFASNQNSGIKTKEEALEWASEQLRHGKVGNCYLAEVTHDIKRSQPPITVVEFRPTISA